MAGRVVWFHLGKLLWPANLVFIYPHWEISQRVWWQYLYPVALGVLLAGLWALRRRSRGPLAALLLFVGALFPTLGFFNAYTFRYAYVADHHQYVASLVIIALVSAGATLVSRRWLAGQRRGWQIAGLVLLGSLATLTWRQSRIYADMGILQRTTLARNPDCILILNNLGGMLFEQGRVDEAMVQFQKALAVSPKFPDSHNNLANALLQKGAVDEAIAHYRAAVAIQSDKAIYCANLGNALVRKGQVEEAIRWYEKAVELEPGSVETLCRLAVLLGARGRTRDSIQHYRAALKAQPTSTQALNNLAWILAANADPQVRNGAEAVALAEQACQLSEHKQAVIVGTLAAAYAEAGRFPEAVAAAEEAARLADQANEKELAARNRKLLDTYRSGKPVRDEP